MISLNIQKRKAYGSPLLAIVMLDLRDSSANYISNSDGVFQLPETLFFVEILLNRVQSTGIEDDERKEMALEGLCVLLDACGKSLDENAVETSELHRCWSSLKGMLDCDDGDDRKTLTFRMNVWFLICSS